jgi:hypothetical protein
MRYDAGMSKPVPRPIDLDYGEQDENGVDLTLIRYMLSLTPRERVEKLNRASRDSYELFEIGRRHRETRSTESR